MVDRNIWSGIRRKKILLHQKMLSEILKSQFNFLQYLCNSNLCVSLNIEQRGDTPIACFGLVRETSRRAKTMKTFISITSTLC